METLSQRSQSQVLASTEEAGPLTAGYKSGSHPGQPLNNQSFNKNFSRAVSHWISVAMTVVYQWLTPLTFRIETSTDSIPTRIRRTNPPAQTHPFKSYGSLPTINTTGRLNNPVEDLGLLEANAISLETDPLLALFPKPIKDFFQEEEQNPMALFPWLNKKNNVKNNAGSNELNAAVNTSEETALTDNLAEANVDMTPESYDYNDQSGPDWVVLGDVNDNSKERLKNTLSNWLKANPSTQATPQQMNDAMRQSSQQSAFPANSINISTEQNNLSDPQAMSIQPIDSILVPAGHDSDDEDLEPGDIQKLEALFNNDYQDHHVEASDHSSLQSDNNVVYMSAEFGSFNTPEEKVSSAFNNDSSPKQSRKSEKPLLDPRRLDLIDEEKTSRIAINNQFLSQSINNLAQQYFEQTSDEDDDELGLDLF